MKMTKDEIDKKVFELQSYEVIRHFIQQRIAELEAQSEERTVAQNYIDSFLDYASSKRYGNFSDIIYDPSHFVSFLNSDKKLLFGYYKISTEEEDKSLKMCLKT